MSQVTTKADPRSRALPSRTSPIIDLRVIAFSQSWENSRRLQSHLGGSPRLLRHISRGGTESTPENFRQTVYLETGGSRHSRGCGVAWYPTGFGSPRPRFESEQPHSSRGRKTRVLDPECPRGTVPSSFCSENLQSSGEHRR